MQHAQSNPTQGIGIAGIIIGIFSIFFAIIPCTIFLGIILGVIGLILTIIGINQATKLNVQKGLLIAGLITSIMGLLIALLWGLAFTEMFNQNNVKERIEHINEYMDEESIDDIDDLIETSDIQSEELDSIEYATDKTMQKLEQYMDELEEQKPAKPDSIEGW